MNQKAFEAEWVIFNNLYKKEVLLDRFMPVA